MRTELAVTGLGLVLPCGAGADAARRALAEGRAAFGPLSPELGGGLGAACTGFDPGPIPMMLRRRLDRASRFAWGAAREALDGAGLDPAGLGGELGLAVGSSLGGFEQSEAFMLPCLEEGPAAGSPMLFPGAVVSAIAGNLGLGLGLRGPSFTQLGRENACFHALEQAALWLERGELRAVLVVGADGLFPLLGELLDRCRMRARREEGPGLLPGEGAQAFVLERRRSAEVRGARVLARLEGIATCAPSGPRRALRAAALAEAAQSLTPGALGAWVGGASGLPLLDAVEAPLRELRPDWPAPLLPKRLWGEFCGSGGQLLAAALLHGASPALVTAPASMGAQYAALLRFDG